MSLETISVGEPLPMRAALAAVLVTESLDKCPFSVEAQAADLVLKCRKTTYTPEDLCQDVKNATVFVDRLAVQYEEKCARMFGRELQPSAGRMAQLLSEVANLARSYQFVPDEELHGIVDIDYPAFMREYEAAKSWPNDPRRAYQRACGFLVKTVSERIARFG